MRSTPNHLVRDHWVLFNDRDGTLVDDNDVTRNDITQQECYMAVYNSNVSESPIVAPVLQDNSHIQITPASATIVAQNKVLQGHSHSPPQVAPPVLILIPHRLFLPSLLRRCCVVVCL